MSREDIPVLCGVMKTFEYSLTAFERHTDKLHPPMFDSTTSEVRNPMMDALKATAHRTFTENGAPAYSSTTSPLLDAFQGLRPHARGDNIFPLLDRAWKEDPELTLRIIWNARSIHDGKGEREVFYQ